MFKHPADNHHESQPEKRRRPELSSSGQPTPSKTANKQMTANMPTKTNPSAVTTGSASLVPSTVTPATTSATTTATKGSFTLGQTTTAPPSDDPVDSNVKSGDASSLKIPQASSIPSPMSGKSTLSNGKNASISDGLSSITKTVSTGYDGDRIPNIDDNQVILPPKRIEKDAAESVTGDYEPPDLDDFLWTGVDIAENVKRKAIDATNPKRKSARLTAMVSLNCGTSDEAAKVLVTIAKNGLDTRFEVTQEGSES